MPTLTEGKHPGEFIVAEARGDRSRDTIVVALGQNVSAGAVLGVVTATGKYVALAPGAGDGSQTAAGISIGNYNATLADKPGAAVTRSCTVNASDLVWGAANPAQIAAAKVQLAALGIICRTAI